MTQKQVRALREIQIVEVAQRRTEKKHQARMIQLREISDAIALSATDEKLSESIIHIAQAISELNTRLTRKILNDTFEAIFLCKLNYIDVRENIMFEELIDEQRVLIERKSIEKTFDSDDTI
jgi:hypothetical protein